MIMVLMTFKGLVALLTTALAAFGLAGCGTAPHDSGKVQVIAAFYPFQYVAEQVGGDLVEVTSLTQAGVEPHDLELTAQQIASLSKADLVVYQKGFQAAVDEGIEINPPRKALDLATTVDLLSGDSHGEHEESHDEGENHATDPHTWLDPANMQAFATAIAAALGEVDPAKAETFTRRANELNARLASLNTRFDSGLRSCEVRQFITAHTAFGYLANAYDLEQIGISGFDPNVEPTTARIEEVQKIVAKYKITTIFFETLTSPDVANSVASDLGIETAVLDPVAGITSESEGSNYIQIMDANLTALKKANRCS